MSDTSPQIHLVPGGLQFLEKEVDHALAHINFRLQFLQQLGSELLVLPPGGEDLAPQDIHFNASRVLPGLVFLQLLLGPEGTQLRE